MASGGLTRRHLQTSGCPDLHPYYSSPADNSSKCAGHFCRGNKAPTAKQRHHTSCLSSWDGSVNWPYCSTIFFFAKLEATSWSRAILFARKGLDGDNYDGSFCFFHSSGRDQHRPLYSYKISLTVPGYCYRDTDNNKCCSRLGFHVVDDNQGGCSGSNRQWKHLLDIFASEHFDRNCYHDSFHSCCFMVLRLHLLRDTTTSKAPQSRTTASRGSPKNQERQKSSYYSGNHPNCCGIHLFTSNNNWDAGYSSS